MVNCVPSVTRIRQGESIGMADPGGSRGSDWHLASLAVIWLAIWLLNDAILMH